jgi:hypothetical protein
MGKRIQYSEGEQIGEVFYLKDVGIDQWRNRIASFRCRCGKVFECLLLSVKRNMTRSCGCLAKENSKRRKGIPITHGHSMPGSKYYKEYRAWQTVRNKCLNKRYIKFSYWGGRGIKMCKRWHDSFENFLEDMGPAPTRLHTLDRFPNNETGHYKPGNCRWATMKEQSNNRRSTRMIIYNGKAKSITEWAETV